MFSRFFFVFFIFSTLFILAFLPTIDPDFFWHLKTGKLILLNGFPTGDPYSYIKFGSPWHLHEWLSEVIIFKIFDLAGSEALSTFFSFLIISTFIFVYLRSEEKPYISGFTTFIVAFVSSVAWGVRPQIFNMFLTSIFIFILERIRSGKCSIKSYLPLFLLLMLWINLHSGAILGAVLISIYATLNFLWPKDNANKPNFLLASGIILFSFLSLLASPHGTDVLVYPFETLFSPAMKTYIDEWHSPDFHTDTGLPFYVLLVLTVLLTMISKARPTLSEGVLIFGSLSQALMSYRNIPFFCICVGPYISRAIGDLISTLPRMSELVRPTTRRESILVKIVFSFLICAYSYIGITEIKGRSNRAEEDIRKDFPVDALIVLKKLNPKRIFNFYSWGGYLIWNDVPVFIDGRADMYGDEFFNKYAEVANVKENTSQILNDYDVDYVLYPTGHSLVNYLKVEGQYREVYQDKLASILQKEVRH